MLRAPGVLAALRGRVTAFNAAAARTALAPGWELAAAGLVLLLLGLWWWWFSSDHNADETGLQKDEAGRVKDKGFRRTLTAKARYGVLQRNFDAEELHVNSTHMFDYSGQGISSKTFKMLHYDTDRATGWSAAFHLGNTCIADAHLWRTCSVYLVLSVCLAMLSGIAHSYRETWDVDETARLLSDASVYLSALLSFMLGLFVSEIISRWWRCRMDCIEALWCALSDIQLLLSMKATAPEDAVLKENVLRLSLVAHRLLYAEARGQEGVDFLESLVSVGLLEQPELKALDGQPAKGQLVLVWIGLLYTQLAKQRGWSGEFLKSLNEQTLKARGAMGKTFAYCTTQLPYQYVHLLSFCVLLCNILLAAKCGLVIGSAAVSGRTIQALLQVFQVVVQPFAYHAFLRLCCELSNPFGHDFSDFPGFAYHCYIRGEGFAIHKAGENPPENIRLLAQELEESS